MTFAIPSHASSILEFLSCAGSLPLFFFIFFEGLMVKTGGLGDAQKLLVLIRRERTGEKTKKRHR
uniref:Uncharacterized protein n=1 Tax=Nelumbo nucifera TaxID=4432 RepID=A0A822ZB92_NELNU|nr:TPA_asm: hypothetical protein HUJ06_014629 [Nelumbo nucifera]